MASDFSVKVVRVSEISPIPSADRLELAHIAGWQCVIQKGAFTAGGLAIYIPIDSILSKEVEDTLFPPDSKVKLSKSRVKTIKLRGCISQGMLAKCSVFKVPEKEGYDCTKQLGITKFEPPEAPPSMTGSPAPKKNKNPYFAEYGGLDNFKHNPNLFQEGEEVIITEKVHGTNFRFGWVPSVADTLLKKVKKLFGLLPKYEFVFGSNKVQLQSKSSFNKDYYQKMGIGNVYEETVIKYDLKKKTEGLKGHVFYGEVYGSGIQKGYAYGCKEGERKLVLFDVMIVGNGYTDQYFVESLCSKLGLDVVPVLYKGPFNTVKAKDLTKGNSVMVPSQKVIEGVVIRPIKEEKCQIGRKVLKLISDEYLLGDNTDFH